MRPNARDLVVASSREQSARLAGRCSLTGARKGLFAKSPFRLEKSQSKRASLLSPLQLLLLAHRDILRCRTNLVARGAKRTLRSSHHTARLWVHGLDRREGVCRYVAQRANGPGISVKPGRPRPASTPRFSADGWRWVIYFQSQCCVDTLYAPSVHAHGCVYESVMLRRHRLGNLASVEKRTESRQRVLKGGTIEFGEGVIDLSATGAMLNVASPVGIPERFTLLVRKDGQHRRCRVIWRSEKQIGVVFT